MKARALLVIVSAWVLSACGVASSENILTSEIYPTLEVAAGGGAVTCRAVFRQGNAAGPDVTLTGGDTVSCSDGTVTVQMNESSELFSSAVEYVGTGLPYNASATYRVIVRRPKSDETFTSTVTLPTEVTISSPTSFNITKGDPILITWVGATSNGILATVTYSLSPDGSFATGTTSSFSAAKRPEAAGSSGQLSISDYTINNSANLVEAKIRLTRDRDGSHDGNWGGRGQIVASQYSEVAGWFSTDTLGNLRKKSE